MVLFVSISRAKTEEQWAMKIINEDMRMMRKGVCGG
jgi:hypothetical protein